MSERGPHDARRPRPSRCALLGALAVVVAVACGASPAAAASLGRCSPFSATGPSAAYDEDESPRLAVPEASGGVLVATPAEAPGAPTQNELPVVDVHAHVIDPAGPAEALTPISALQLEAQVQRLDEAFAKVADFRLATIDRAANTDWYTMEGGAAEREAKEALHRGDASDLNMYYVGPGDGNWATFPWDYRRDRRMDGVVIRAYNHSPPTAAAPRVEGAEVGGEVGVHEVGHWFGLYHTWQGGCSRWNDLVEDTPAHDPAADTPGVCLDSEDTCPAAGKDPVHNFMNSGGEACWTHFTEGQEARARAMWRSYRARGK